MIFESLESLNVLKSNLVLLISDAATYMIKADEIFKSFYNNFMHIKCVAHLKHNCSMLIGASLNQLIK
jgi:hypothetical protein